MAEEEKKKKKPQQRVVYVLDNGQGATDGHTLGVNGLAIDSDNGVLYSGGRDGIVCTWDLNMNLRSPTPTTNPPKTAYRTQTVAHTHWINDLALAANNTAVVTASSDLTVKVWRPQSQEPDGPPIAHQIGEHADYAKCLAVPPVDMGANWVASGGLDRKICLWDINGNGQTLEIDVQGDETAEKGSVYSLAAGRNMLACGGPEKVVRLYDPRSGVKISNLVGHVDNIRSILVDGSGETILSASSDKTVKMWSLKSGRCMYTFTMHDDSVWSLYSEDPTLGVFYSADRSGMVAKTDVRGTLDDMDNGLSLALFQENFGVGKVIASGGHVWAATNKSSINRWDDVDTSSSARLPEAFRRRRAVSSVSARSNSAPATDAKKEKEISPASILRLSNTATFSLRSAMESTANVADERKGSELTEVEPEVQPVSMLPNDTIEGQFGLLKHRLLSNKRQVLTLDTAGDVLLWDLILCRTVRSFGKQHLEDVAAAIDFGTDSIAPWCSIDLSAGNLTVALAPGDMFDAENYADMCDYDEKPDFKEDQRWNLGKWILRYLCANLIDEEIKRDEAYRHQLNEEVEKRRAANGGSAPMSIAIPQTNMTSWGTSDSTTTPRANGSQFTPTTPGMGIGMATPGPVPNLPGVPEGAALDSPMSPSKSTDAEPDYFNSTIAPVPGEKATTPATPAAPASATDTQLPALDTTTPSKDTKAADTKSPTTGFGKKFRMSFGTKKLGRSPSQPTTEKPNIPAPVPDEKAEESESSESHEKDVVVDNTFHGAIQKIHAEYDRQLSLNPLNPVQTLIHPSLPSETPVLKLPPKTKVIIQQETSGANTTIWAGTVSNIGDPRNVDIIERKAHMWLGDALLRNILPIPGPDKVTKTSFVLKPHEEQESWLRAINGPVPEEEREKLHGGTHPSWRLNANRMLRVKKVLAYVSEKIEVETKEGEEGYGMRPEEYLELWMYDEILDPNMTIISARNHIWKGGADIMLRYRANGKKKIISPPLDDDEEEGEKSAASTDGVTAEEGAAATAAAPEGGEAAETAGGGQVPAGQAA